MNKIIIRIMGESDIVDVVMQSADAPKNPLIDGHDDQDKINLLGHWMDQDRGVALAEDADHFVAMGIIASEFIAQHPLSIMQGARSIAASFTWGFPRRIARSTHHLPLPKKHFRHGKAGTISRDFWTWRAHCNATQ